MSTPVRSMSSSRRSWLSNWSSEPIGIRRPVVVRTGAIVRLAVDDGVEPGVARAGRGEGGLWEDVGMDIDDGTLGDHLDLAGG